MSNSTRKATITNDEGAAITAATVSIRYGKTNERAGLPRVSSQGKPSALVNVQVTLDEGNAHDLPAGTVLKGTAFCVPHSSGS